MMRARRIGSVGDVNPIEHGGGFIYKVPGQDPYIEYTPGMEDDSEDDSDVKLLVYRVDVPSCAERLLSDLAWVDFSKVEQSCGYEESPWGKLSTLNERAALIQDVAGYYGWYELDQYPLELTVSELKKRWRQ